MAIDRDNVYVLLTHIKKPIKTPEGDKTQVNEVIEIVSKLTSKNETTATVIYDCRYNKMIKDRTSKVEPASLLSYIKNTYPDHYNIIDMSIKRFQEIDNGSH